MTEGRTDNRCAWRSGDHWENRFGIDFGLFLAWPGGVAQSFVLCLLLFCLFGVVLFFRVIVVWFVLFVVFMLFFICVSLCCVLGLAVLVC